MKYSRYNIEVPMDDKDSLIVFNTFSRSIVILSRELVTLLMKGSETVCTTEEREALHGANVLVDEDRDEVSHMRYSFMKRRFEKDTLAMFIGFSSRCNFRCSYCYQDLRNAGGNLSEENWIRLLSFVKDHVSSKKTKNIEVVLFGGEPLVNYRVLIRAVKDLKSLQKNDIKVKIDLITNGSLMNKDKILELTPYIDSTQITIDGPARVHDRRRPYANGTESFQDVFANLIECTKSPNMSVSLRVNVDQGNLHLVHELLAILETEGLHRKLGSIDFSPIFPSQQAILAGRTDNVETGILSAIVDQYRYAVKAGFKVGKKFIIGPCMSYFENSFAVDESLRVYKCPGYLYGQPDGFIGADGILRITNARWYNALLFEPECLDDCVYAPICYGGCRWRACGVSSINCNKTWFENTLAELLLSYVTSNHMQGTSY